MADSLRHQQKRKDLTPAGIHGTIRACGATFPASGCNIKKDTTMIITKEEAVNLLTNGNNLLKGKSDDYLIDEFVDALVNPDKPPLSVPPGTRRNIPPIFREIIAIQSNVTGAAKSQTAAAFGISGKHAGRLHNGHVSPIEALERRGKTTTDIELGKALESSLAIVRDKALDRIGKSLDYIKDEALEVESPKTLSTIAANLSRIVSSTMRDKNQFTQNNVQTIFMTPKESRIGEYDVIDVDSR